MKEISLKEIETTNTIFKLLRLSKKASEKCFLTIPNEGCEKTLAKINTLIPKIKKMEDDGGLSLNESQTVGELLENVTASGACKATLNFLKLAGKDTHSLMQVEDYCKQVDDQVEKNILAFMNNRSSRR